MLKKMSIVVLSLLVIVLGVLNYKNLQEIRNLKKEKSVASQNNTVSENSAHKSETIEEQKLGKKNIGAFQVNADFIDAFFMYKDTNVRLDKVKPMLTEEGLLKAYPSGISEKNNSDVKAEISGLEVYDKKLDEKHIRFINEFMQTISFGGGKKNTIKRIVKTDVIQVDGGEWKVNNVELVDQ